MQQEKQKYVAGLGIAPGFSGSPETTDSLLAFVSIRVVLFLLGCSSRGASFLPQYLTVLQIRKGNRSNLGRIAIFPP